MRSLNDIREDIKLCEEYMKMGTPQAAFRWLHDMNKNLLALLEHVAEMEEPNDDRPDDARR